jgi:hypothetical protein
MSVALHRCASMRIVWIVPATRDAAASMQRFSRGRCIASLPLSETTEGEKR